MKNNEYSFEDQLEAMNELGPTAVNVLTGKSVFTKEFLACYGIARPRPVNTTRRAKATVTLNKIERGASVSFPYNGQTFTATVDKINTTTATVTITKVEGRSNNPRQRPILPGATGVRVPASILARSL
jgi:hypothetical protein